jgi:hypothetical protein
LFGTALLSFSTLPGLRLLWVLVITLFGPLHVYLGYDEGNLPIGEDAGLGLMNNAVAAGLLLLTLTGFLGALPV